MSGSTENQAAVTTLAKGRFLQLVERRRWEFVERPGIRDIVVIAGKTRHGGLVLVSQWREPAGGVVVEWPAGLVGDEAGAADERSEDAARRELLEETGFEAEGLEAVFRGPPSPGISSEMVSFYLARGLRRRGKGGGVGSERIRTHVVAASKLEKWLGIVGKKGWKTDPKVFAGVYWLQRREAGEDE